MLGLGNSIVTSGGVQGLIPTDISGLDLWLKFNTGIAGASNTTAAGNMSNTEVIHSWADQAENHNAEQNTDAHRPTWAADTNDLSFATVHMDLASNVEIDANEDFSIVIRHKFPDFDSAYALMGTNSNDVIKVNNNASITVKIDTDGDDTPSAWAESSDTLATDVYYIFTLVRSGGSDGYLKIYVHGGAYSDKSWDDVHAHQDADAFTLGNIGAAADTVLNLVGNMRDVIVYKGTALTAGQRADLYSYINAQT